MATNNIPSANALSVIPASHHNSLKEALGGDIVPRNTSGVPTNEAGDLGTSTYRFKDLYVRSIDSEGNFTLTGSITSTSGGISVNGNIETSNGVLQVTGNISTSTGDLEIDSGKMVLPGGIIWLSSDGSDRLEFNSGTNTLTFFINNVAEGIIDTTGVRGLANNSVSNSTISDNVITNQKRLRQVSSIGVNWNTNTYLNATGSIGFGSPATFTNEAGSGGASFFAYELSVTGNSGNTITLSDNQATPTTIESFTSTSSTDYRRGVYFGARTGNSTITLSTSSGTFTYTLKVMALA